MIAQHLNNDNVKFNELILERRKSTLMPIMNNELPEEEPPCGYSTNSIKANEESKPLVLPL